MTKEKPIIFSTEMVQAILEGRKTQTRRVVKFPKSRHEVYRYEGPTPTGKHEFTWGFIENGRCYDGWILVKAPYPPGNILWVRETFAQIRNIEDGHIDTFYAANKKDCDTVSSTYLCDDDGFETDRHIPWKPSIHMPREAARLFLRVKKVRAERVQDISAEDCEAEGYFETAHVEPRPRSWFSTAWDARNAKSGYGWDTNPWVWVYSFKRVDKPAGWPGGEGGE